MVVDVALKLLIDNVKLVDKPFKFLNIVIDVALKSLFDNVKFNDHKIRCFAYDWMMTKFIINKDLNIDFHSNVPSFVFNFNAHQFIFL